MRGGRGAMGHMPRFRGGGRGFMGPGQNRGGHPGLGPPEHRLRPPMRYRHNWSDDLNFNEPEVFAETRMPDGRCYYYNTRTRETMWERPEGPGVRIIRHEDAINKGRGGGPGQGPPGVNFQDRGFHDNEHKPMGLPGPNPNAQPFQQGPPNSMPVGFQQGKPPLKEDIKPPIELVTHSTEEPAPGTSPPGFQAPPQVNQPQKLQGPPPHNMMVPPPGTQGNMQRFTPPGQKQSMMPPGGGPRMEGFGPGSMGPPMGNQGFPPPGFMQGPGPHGNPPFGMPPPGSFPQSNFMQPPWGGFPPGIVPPTGVPPPMADPVIAQVDVQLASLAAEWTEHVAPDGKYYYFSSKAQTSTWEKPKVLIDFDAAKFQIQQRMMAVQQAAMNPVTVVSAQVEQDPANVEKSKTKRETKKVEKCRPVSSTPVSGTPWCVVWTGDRRVFFYNPATKTSVWERPMDLVGRVDVDEMVRACPDKTMAKTKLVEATSTTSPLSDGSDKEKKGKVEAAVVASKVETQPSVEASANEPPQKKLRTSSQDVIVVEGETQKNSEAKETIESKDALKELTALEAEAKASRERATIPMEVRLKQFRDMLIEKNVSAFSTWEKELHKIVFDQRYLLLTSSERKRAFDRYVEEIMEEEKREKQNRLKLMKDKFFAFLSEINISSKMNYTDFSQKYGRDERFRCVEKSRDREAFFQDYLKMVQKKEKEERALRKERDREEFLEMLNEKVKDYHYNMQDLRKKLESDSRFQAVDYEDREEIYRGFQRRLRHEQRSVEKQKRKDRAAAREKKETRDKTEVKEDETTEKGEIPADGTEDISEEEEGCITDDSDDDVRLDREKQERAEQSIREREKQVQRSLATHLRDRDKEREIHRHEEAVQEYQALLTDVVRNVDMSWKEAKKVLKKDRRWSIVSLLPREEIEDLFTAHVDSITRKKKQRFKELLDEHCVNSKTRWRDLYSKINSDPRCTKFSTSERKCQREFEDYLKDMSASMKVDFRELLKETKMLTYKTSETLKQNSNFMKEIESHLENDRRYLQLDSLPGERQRLIHDYIEDLELRGPPPPPTASEPARRKGLFEVIC